MKGVLLINMGGANSPKELKSFLGRMFNDPFILPFGKTGRKMLSFIISNSRYKRSWKKYMDIGGTPIIRATEYTKKVLQLELGTEYMVEAAFSYSKPLIREAISVFVHQGFNEITVIPLYPQASFTTTDSVKKEVYDAVEGNENIKINFVHEFCHHPVFVSFWSKLIENHNRTNQCTAPYLLFSAHSIPEYLVDKGDTYPQGIHKSAKAIAGKMGYEYGVAYQSGMKRGKWLGPDVKQSLRTLSAKGINEIILIPISFVNENLETLYDMDRDILPFAKELSGIHKISRVNIPVADAEFVKLLHDLVKTNELK